MACGEIDRRPLASLLDEPLPPRCEVCTGVLRPAVVLFEEMLPERPARLQEQSRIGFDAVLVVGTTASFGYILEPIWRARQSGGLVVEVNLQPTDINPLANLSLQEGPQTFCRTYYVTFHPIEFDHRSDSGHSRGHFEITDTCPCANASHPRASRTHRPADGLCRSACTDRAADRIASAVAKPSPGWLRLRGLSTRAKKSRWPS